MFELDYRQGRAVKRFAFGDPPEAGDFEGIARVDGRLFLVTSDGDLLEGAPVASADHVPFRRHRSGLGERCEIEGLELDKTWPPLLLLCKQAREEALAGRVAILAWSLEDEAPAPRHDRITPWPGGTATPLNPSGLAYLPGSDHIVIVAARQRGLVELDGSGRMLPTIPLPDRAEHPQVEGIAITPAGELILADEGRGRRGRLSVYTPAP